MNLGVEVIFDGRPGNTLRELGSTAQMLEEMGFSRLWYSDHVVVFEEYEPNFAYTPDGRPPVLHRNGWYDPLMALAAAAAATSRIRLGTGVIILTERHPVLLAKDVVALDHLSEGRLDLGIGVGWSPEEFAAVGNPLRTTGGPGRGVPRGHDLPLAG